MATKSTKKTTNKRSKVENKVEKPVVKGKYGVTVFIGGQEYFCQTDDIAGALISLRPTKITNKVIVKVEKDKKVFERMLFVFPARRIFNIPMATQFFVKNIINYLK